MAMASVADRLEMTEVRATIEKAIVGQLSVDVCGEVLMGSARLGLVQVEAGARVLALERFEEVAGTEGFMQMDEEAVGSLLDDNELCVSKEEAVLEAVVRWMQGGGGELRGRGLLSKIRYCVLDTEYLAADAHRLLPAEHADWIDGHLHEALRVKAGGGQRELIGSSLLGGESDVRRAWPGVRWERYWAGSERRLQYHELAVCALAECEGRMCSGSSDGSILVMGGATLVHERTLRDEEDINDGVFSLAAWEGLLISGHHGGVLRVWNVATGVCDRKLERHYGPVRCLAVLGTRLVSGSDDKSIKVWAMGAGAAWPCERTLAGHGGSVRTLVTWQGKVLSGSGDNSVRVWDIGTGAHDATLIGHQGSVLGLAVYGDRLFSASQDGTIREWALGTWAVVRTVEAYLRWGGQFPRCLAVSGSKLISGSQRDVYVHQRNVDCRDLDDERCEVRVWDLGTLECEHTLLQPASAMVWCLAAGCGVLWGGVGKEAVVWGRA
jgi:hypothetical protein